MSFHLLELKTRQDINGEEGVLTECETREIRTKSMLSSKGMLPDDLDILSRTRRRVVEPEGVYHDA